MNLLRTTTGTAGRFDDRRSMTVMTLAAEVAAQGHWGPGPWWPIFPLFWVLLLGIVIFLVFRLRRGGRWDHKHSAEDVLAERYARGEISVDEYRERLTVLKERAS
jgi:putative membrane protein